MPSFDLPLNINDPDAKILMDAVNYENQTSYDYNDFIYGEPESASLLNTIINTKIRITPKVGTLYYNSKDFFYRRMDLGQIYETSKISIQVGSRTLLSELIPEINEYYGINLKPGTYVDQVLPVEDPQNPGAPLIVALQANPGALLFQGVALIELNTTPAVLEEDRFDRRVYILVDNEDASIYQNTVVVYDTKFEPVTTFTLLRNCTNVTQFNATKIIPLSNGNIALRGVFKFDSVLSGSNVTYDVNSIILAPNGAVIKIGNPHLFGPAGITNWYGHYSDPHKYVIDTANEINTDTTTKTYRYTNDGELDITFVATGLGYVPQHITTDKSGRIYTASDPYNASGWKLRIDRLLASGILDPNYTPIIFEIAGVGQPLGIIQMRVNELNELFVALRPVTGVSSLDPSPIINGETVIPGNTTQVYGYTPVFKFKETGVWDKSFKNENLNIAPTAIYDTTGSNMLPNDNVIGVDGNVVMFYTNIINPITGFRQRMPLSFDKYGTPIRLAGQDYESQVRWDSTKQLLGLTNGRAIAFGMGYTKNPSGGWSALTPLVAAYFKNASGMKIIHKPTRATAGPDLVIRDVAITELGY